MAVAMYKHIIIQFLLNSNNIIFAQCIDEVIVYQRHKLYTCNWLYF